MTNCPTGMFYRKSYTRNGTRVAGKCLRSTTRYASPYKPRRPSMRGRRRSARTLKNCPTGYIKRSSFLRTTRSGKRSLVRERCVRNVGLPGKGFKGKGPGIGPLREGELSQFGYSGVAKLSQAQRHAALRKAVDRFGSLGVWRKLNAVAVYTKYTSPAVSRIFKSDMAWIQREFGLKAF